MAYSMPCRADPLVRLTGKSFITDHKPQGPSYTPRTPEFRGGAVFSEI